MIIRPAKKSDLRYVDMLYSLYDFKLDPQHIQSLAVAEEDDKIIAVMSINTVLECCFLTNQTASRRDKIVALKRLVEVGKQEVSDLKYDGVHAFANEAISGILKKHFDFVPAKGENLFLFV